LFDLLVEPSPWPRSSFCDLERAYDVFAIRRRAVLCFVLIALAGIRVPYALIAGYLLHGLWDVIHELHAHAGLSVFEPEQTTAIPLAYGAFCCATYDLCMAGYFFTRRADWNAAWTGT